MKVILHRVKEWAGALWQISLARRMGAAALWVPAPVRNCVPGRDDTLKVQSYGVATDSEA